MKLIPTQIAGCFRIQLAPLRDARGHFTAVLDTVALRETNPQFCVERVNRSLTRAPGAIRGLHYQIEPHAEDKVVQCVGGRIFDVCVDMRPDSPTRFRWVGVELSLENEELLWIPRGCAHGFQALTEDCLIEYFCSDVYAPELERGARWDDPLLAIRWPLPCSQTSDKDAAWPRLTR
jgi:dTDP-4-dehydrorhamnose 3,5-epimerase